MSFILVTVKVLGRRRGKKIKLPPRARIVDLLKLLGYNPQVVVTRRNGKIVVEQERLADGDLIEVIPIVTGG
jgi:sulfur carrier protein